MSRPITQQAPIKSPATPVADPSTLQDGPSVGSGWVPPRRALATNLTVGVLSLAAICTVLYAWNLPPFSSDIQETNDAYVRGQVTVISPQVSGYITLLPVQDFQQVKAGDLLAKIDDRIYGAKVAQAEANLAAQLATLSNSNQSEHSRQAALTGQLAGIYSAQAQLARARADMDRAASLVADGSISERERDQTRAAELQAQAALRQAYASANVGREEVKSVQVGRGSLAANVDGARAQLRLAQVDLDNTYIRAPSDGQLSELGVRSGAFVTSGSQLMFLVPNSRWVIANFREAQTHNMRVGQRADVRVDALDGAVLKGHIQSLAPAAGSEFSVLKPDNATGNFVKVAQRIAVRISIDPQQRLANRLRPGMSVVVDVRAPRS